jgi:polyisoprenoid-binding protein YceI
VRRSLVLAAGAGGLLLLLVSGLAYAYFFSGLRTAPKPLALSSPSAGAGISSSAGASTSLNGRWTVTSGSQSGYRVREQFVGQSSSHEAVARTSAVSGGVTVQSTAGGLEATGLRFVVKVGQLQSVDQVAGYNVSNRDRFVSRSLNVDQYPEASFQAQSVALPATLQEGGQATLSVPGQVTVHGVTRDATATVQVQASGSQVHAAGSVPIDMTNFGITPPEVPFTKSDSKVTIEFDLTFVKGE